MAVQAAGSGCSCLLFGVLHVGLAVLVLASPSRAVEGCQRFFRWQKCNGGSYGGQ